MIILLFVSIPYLVLESMEMYDAGWGCNLALKCAGEWIYGKDGNFIISRVEPCIYSDKICISPKKTYAEIIADAEAHDANYIIIDTSTVRYYSPDLAPLLNGSDTLPGFSLVTTCTSNNGIANIFEKIT